MFTCTEYCILISIIWKQRECRQSILSGVTVSVTPVHKWNHCCPPEWFQLGTIPGDSSGSTGMVPIRDI